MDGELVGINNKFAEFHKVLSTYDFEFYVVDFFSAKMYQILQKWVEELNRRSAIHIKISGQICESDFIVAAAADRKSEFHDVARKRLNREKVKQDACSCGMVAAAAVREGRLAASRGKQISGIDFGVCVLPPSENTLAAVAEVLPRGTFKYPHQFISAVGIHAAILHDLRHLGDNEWVVPQQEVGIPIDMLMMTLREIFKHGADGPTHLVVNDATTADGGHHWTYVCVTKTYRRE